MSELFGKFRRKHYFLLLGFAVFFSILGLGIKYLAKKKKYSSKESVDEFCDC